MNTSSIAASSPVRNASSVPPPSSGRRPATPSKLAGSAVPNVAAAPAPTSPSAMSEPVEASDAVTISRAEYESLLAAAKTRPPALAVECDLDQDAEWQEQSVNRVGDLLANLADAMTYLVLDDADNAETHVLAAIRNASHVRFGLVELGKAMVRLAPRVEAADEIGVLRMHEDRLRVQWTDARGRFLRAS